MLILATVAIILLIFGAGVLRVSAKIFFAALSLILSAAILTFKAICVFIAVLAGVIFLALQKITPYAVKYLSTAATWLIAALVTAALLIYAAGRNILHGENFVEFVKELIPNKRISIRTDFSLLIIEVADAVHSEIVSKLETQYKKILAFFKPLE